MRSELQEIPDARNCKCGNRPIYFNFDGPAGIVFHRMACQRCGKKITSLQRFRAITNWSVYMDELAKEGL